MQITHLDGLGRGFLTERTQLLVQLLKQAELRSWQGGERTHQTDHRHHHHRNNLQSNLETRLRLQWALVVLWSIQVIHLDHPFQGAEMEQQSGAPGRLRINGLDALGVEHAMAINNQIKQRSHGEVAESPLFRQEHLERTSPK